MTDHTCTSTDYDPENVEAETIFDNGRYCVDAMLHPDGTLCEFQVFKWSDPFAWEASGHWDMISAGAPYQFDSVVPQAAKDAANAWLAR
jgi:hypothetical protein